MKKFSILFSAALLIVCTAGCGSDDKPDPAPVRTSYVNPVSSEILPDPSVVKGDDGYYYLYATEDIRGIPIMRSSNLIDWKQVGIVFSEAHRPKLDGMTDGGLWAPDASPLGDGYILYYSYAPGNSIDGWGHGIGVATASRPEGPWTDKGKIFISGDIGVRYSIDPCFVHEDDGSNWLFWGSYFGIWAIELTADGLAVKPGAEKQRVAGLDGYGLEGAMVHRHDGKYYLFVSEGGAGYDNNYKIGVARSDKLLGPYLNKSGEEVAGGAPVDFFLTAGNGFISPGHCSEIITDANGADWILYHAYVEGQPEGGRRLMLGRLEWNEGWPVIGEGVPTFDSQTVPSL